MAYYTVAAVTPTNDSWIPDYLAAVGPLVEKHGGKYLARTASHEQLEGDGNSPALQVIIEWPSKEASDAFWSDPAYAPQRQARIAGSQSTVSSVAGQDDFAN